MANKELGLVVIYKDVPLSPTDIVQLQKEAENAKDN